MAVRSLGVSVLTLIMAHAVVAPVFAQSDANAIICGDTYVVQPGDSLSQIAQRAYGMGRMYDRLIDANPETLRGDPDRLVAGMSLAVPCFDASGEEILGEVTMADAVTAEGLLNAQELEALFGPIALFPDEVLTPILYAVTLPLDIVKAGRFVEDSADLTDQERATAAAAQPWDPAVRELAAGFPDLVTRMSDHIDWTEQAGDAVLAQTDDVLDTIQRLRSKAVDNGYLVDNEAQTVEVVDDTISIAPAQPGVVYVPTYDYQTIYTTPVAVAPAYYYDDDSYYGDWEDALIGGAIFMGSAIVLDEIFDDDDWDDFGGWDNEDIEIDWDRGDITIDRSEINLGDRELNLDGGDRIDIDGGERFTIGGDRPALGDGDRDIRGALETADRDAAIQRIEARQESDRDLASLPVSRPDERRPRAEERPAARDRDVEVSRPSVDRTPSRPRTEQVVRPSRQDSAFDRPSREVSRDVDRRSRDRPSQGSRRR